MVDGIILAGGYSRRLGRNKMSIVYKNKPVIRHTIEHMQAVCNSIYVVTGFYHDEIKRLIEDIEEVQVVYNADYDKGMFTSVQKGVACTMHDFFIIPGDYPLVQTTVYDEILLGTKGIRVPSFSFKLGHPIFFNQHFKEKLLKTSKDNLKSFRDAYDYEIINVDDEGILFDIDTISDYKKLVEKE